MYSSLVLNTNFLDEDIFPFISIVSTDDVADVGAYNPNPAFDNEFGSIPICWNVFSITNASTLEPSGTTNSLL